MMSKFLQTLQAVIASICILVYVACAIYAGVNIYKEYKYHSALAKAEFEDLRDFASSAGVLGVSSTTFKKDIEDAVHVSKTLQAVIISGPKDFAFFVEKTPSLVKWNGNYPQFDTGFNFVKRLNPLPLRIDGFNNAGISAVSSIVDFDTLLNILQKVLVGILGAVVVSFIMLITQFFAKQTEATAASRINKKNGIYTEPSRNNAGYAGDYLESITKNDDEDTDAYLEEIDESNNDNESNNKKNEFEFNDDDVFADDNDKFEAKDDIFFKKNELSEDDEDDEDEDDLEDFNFEDFTPDQSIESEEFKIKTDTFENKNENELETEQPVIVRQDEPDSLEDASPDVYEKDIFDELENAPDFSIELEPELEKAEENSEDLCLLSAVWESAEISQNILISNAVKCFGHNIHVFEKNIPGIYVIIPNLSIDDAFKAAKKYYKQVIAEAPEDAGANILIGVSSRAGRNVEALRLIEETEQALTKAREDANQPIVVFKTDIDKYNAFILKKQRNIQS